jgi:hypothetical protein
MSESVYFTVRAAAEFFQCVYVADRTVRVGARLDSCSKYVNQAQGPRDENDQSGDAG